jgi:hypothetical protein
MARTGDEAAAREDVEEDKAVEAEEETMLMVDGRHHIPHPRASITPKQTMAVIPPNLFPRRHICPPHHTHMGNRKDTSTLKLHPLFQPPNTRSR